MDLDPSHNLICCGLRMRADNYLFPSIQSMIGYDKLVGSTALAGSIQNGEEIYWLDYYFLHTLYVAFAFVCGLNPRLYFMCTYICFLGQIIKEIARKEKDFLFLFLGQGFSFFGSRVFFSMLPKNPCRRINRDALTC